MTPSKSRSECLRSGKQVVAYGVRAHNGTADRDPASIAKLEVQPVAIALCVN